MYDMIKTTVHAMSITTGQIPASTDRFRFFAYRNQIGRQNWIAVKPTINSETASTPNVTSVLTSN